MKRFFTRDLAILQLEEERDMQRIGAYFHTMLANSEETEQIKQRVKEKTLQIIAKGHLKPEPTVISKGNRLQKLRNSLRNWREMSRWRLSLSVICLAFIAITGLGYMNSSNSSENMLAELSNPGRENLNTSASSISPSIGSANTSQSQNVTDSSAQSNGLGGSGEKSSLDQKGLETADSVSPQTAGNALDTGSSTVPSDSSPANANMPRKITQDLSVTLQVAIINDAVTSISKEVQKQGGYVTSSQQSGTDSNSSAQITVKIPAEKVSGFREIMATWGNVLNQSMVANDITNQYFDAQTRMQTLEAEEKRYLEILGQAKTVADVLQVENALSNIRQQIEQLKGQLKLWDNIVDYSTVSFQIETLKTPGLNVNNPWQPISWAETWKAAQNAILKTISTVWNIFNYFIVGLGYSLPFILLVGIGWGSYRVWRKRRAQ